MEIFFEMSERDLNTEMALEVLQDAAMHRSKRDTFVPLLLAVAVLAICFISW